MFKANCSDEAHIRLVIGGMFSGKSETLLRRVHRYRIAGKNCVLIKHASDNRYNSDARITTHNNESYDAIAIEKLANLSPELIDANEVFGIDEGQFVCFIRSPFS